MRSLYENQIHLILKKYIRYYDNLSPVDQKLFRKRVFFFIRDIKFRGGNRFKITIEHKVAIAGAAIQLSFGNEQYLFTHFYEIIVYEDVYQNSITKNYHRGEVNPSAGLIVLSWNDFIHGYSTDEDNLNVGLHEMAHAFYFETVNNKYEINSEYDFLSKFMFVSEKEIVRIRNNRSSLFREYAGENVIEFFSVAVEYFFEAGKEFKEKLPELYRQMCLLLNQDTAEGSARGFDYSQYFKETKIINHVPQEEIVEVTHNAIGRVIVNGNKFVLRIFFYLLFVFFLLISAEADREVLYFFSVSAVLLLIILGKIYFPSQIFTTKNYFFLRKNFFNSEKYLGINFESILCAEFESDELKILIKYFSESKLKEIKIMSLNSKTTRVLKHIFVKKGVMLKSNGMRVARIRTHNKRR